MRITNKTIKRTETDVDGYRAALRLGHEGGDMYQIHVTDAGGNRWSSELIDSVVAQEIADEEKDDFLDQAAECFGVSILSDLCN